MTRPLYNQVVVVTGAARGVGRACSVLFAKQGADLLLIDAPGDIPGVPYALSEGRQLDTAAHLARAEGASVMTAACDVRDFDALVDVCRAGLDRFGRIDSLVTSAGIATPAGKAVHETDLADWELVLSVNATGAFVAMRVFLPVMVAAGSGNVLNIASTAGIVGYSRFSAYTASKHAVVGLTRAAALEYASLGIRVNALAPGSIRDHPEMEGRMLAEIARAQGIDQGSYEELFAESVPAHRLIDVHNVANAAAWIISPNACDVTGAVLPIDGAFSAR